MAKQTRTRKPTNEVHLPGSMTLAEVRKLLKKLDGKEVRGQLVDLVWLTLEREGGPGRPYQLCIVPAPNLPRREATTMERVLAMVTRMQCLECGCLDEEELRRVIQDPSQGEWCFDDECPSYYK